METKKVMHKTLSLLFRKNAELDKEEKKKKQQLQREAAEDEGMVQLAKNFTNPNDFKKMVLLK